ncbi:hypothetical protein [Clostridium thailandense]|uniref:hypothetical protein n=1 Tax=Clostridium thailandense TaxID=2794346 RepID=UPI003989A68F
MKKIASIVAAALVTCSISACGNRNTAYRTPGTNQGGTNIGINQGNYNTGMNTTSTYRDGIYLGEGNKSSMGNQAAIVTISGGKITDVVLKTIDAKGKETPYTTGGNAGTTMGGTTTDITRGTVGGNPVGGSNTGTTVRTPADGTMTGSTTGPTITTNLARVRRDLANAVVSQQTHNVNIANAGNDANSVANWKLAISRALDSARR